MEEAPLSDVQRKTQKLEMLSGERMEKYWPGLKERFDDLRNKRASGELTEEEFWARLDRELSGITEENLTQALEDR